MFEMSQFYKALSMGLAVVMIMAYLGGAWACLAHRRLSAWLFAVAGGFVGEALTSAVRMGLAYVYQSALDADAIYQLYHLISLWANVLGVTSTATLVLGLVGALAEIRRKVAVSMEPKHVQT